MNRKIIFVGGVHGVGKTTMCRLLCDQLSLKYLSASELIKWNALSSDPLTKTVNDISDTQNRLLSSLADATHNRGAYVLDGHFSLLDRNGSTQKVPLEVFQQIDPVCLYLITDSPQAIKERLEARDKRDYSASSIDGMQQVEGEHANYVSEQLSVPLYTDFREIVRSVYNLI